MRDRRISNEVAPDRRGGARVPIRCEVEFLLGGITYSAMAENLSLRGAFVATEVEVFDGLAADVTLYLDEGADPVKLVGSIVRLNRRRDERPGFAVEFESVDEATQARIREAVDGQPS